MATEAFIVKHLAGKAVYFRLLDPNDGRVYDFDDDAWEVNLAACVDPKLPAAENTDFGDADESLYIASYNLATIYNIATARSFVVQAVDDLATDEVIAEDEIWIVSGENVAGTAIFSDIAALPAEVVTTLMATNGITAAGVITFEDILRAIYSMSRGQFNVVGDVFTFLDDDDLTPLFALTINPASRTTA